MQVPDEGKVRRRQRIRTVNAILHDAVRDGRHHLRWHAHGSVRAVACQRLSFACTLPLCSAVAAPSLPPVVLHGSGFRQDSHDLLQTAALPPGSADNAEADSCAERSVQELARAAQRTHLRGVYTHHGAEVTAAMELSKLDYHELHRQRPAYITVTAHMSCASKYQVRDDRGNRR